MIWKEIPGYSDYMINDCGEVLRKRYKEWDNDEATYITHASEIRSQYLREEDGLPEVRLREDNSLIEGDWVTVVGLMRIAFCNGVEVEHINGDETDNSLKNLRQIIPAQTIDTVEKKKSGGKRRKRNKVSDSTKQLIRELGRTSMPRTDIAKRAGVPLQYVYTFLSKERTKAQEELL